MKELLTACGPGDVVRVRGARWQVSDTTAFATCLLADLRGADAANCGERRLLLHPYDRFVRVEAEPRARAVGRRTWMRRFRHLAARATPHDRLRAAARAYLDLLPWQLEPALAVVSGLAARLLLADEVGLGKTIQSGLVLSELRERGAADRVLILTPAGLKDQWADELRHRFAIDASIVDAPHLAEMAARLPGACNPWETCPVAIVSVDFVKRPEVLRGLEPLVWDLLIVDEAHAATGDTDRARAVRAVAARARRVLLLTATPHTGDVPAFESLRSIGRLGARDRVLVFRRCRREVGLESRRHVHLRRVVLSQAEQRMHEALARYTGMVWQAARGDESGGARLAMTVLQKRAFSGAEALARSLGRRLAALADVGPPDAWQALLFPPGALAGDEDAEPAGALAAPGLDRPGQERDMLQHLLALASEAATRDSKLGRLTRLLRRSGETAIVFTEYRDSAESIERRLQPAFTVALLHGGLDRTARLAARRAFAAGQARVLVATDVASEGLNLQETCRLVVNLELPWNPLRLEQRIGRVDRLGQRRTVHAFHLVAGGTGEEAVLARLVARLAAVRRVFGTLPDTLGLPGERDVARAVIGGVPLGDPWPAGPWSPFRPAAAGGPSDSTPADHDGPSPDLAPQAVSEARRLEEVRRLLSVRRKQATCRTTVHSRRPSRSRAPDAPALRGPACGEDASGSEAPAETREILVTRLHRSRFCRPRQILTPLPWRPPGPGVVCVFLARLVDGRYRVAEEMLLPVFVPITAAAKAIDASLRGLAALAGRQATGVARAVADERLARVNLIRQASNAGAREREAAMARAIDAHLGRLAAPVQAGLFDRRALRRRDELEQLGCALRRDLDRSSPGASDTLSLAAEPELVLALVVR